MRIVNNNIISSILGGYVLQYFVSGAAVRSIIDGCRKLESS